ncbi:MAG: TonB-dependent receptor [Alphaproteobacteria bacterium]|nr:MAG: TonB-dependent receptor [Alphaproteobacteria bacterium]
MRSTFLPDKRLLQWEDAKMRESNTAANSAAGARRAGLKSSVALGAIAAAQIGVALLAAAPAMAQIENIIVTAEKREENVQDVSLSIQAFDSDGLNKAGIEDVSRLEFLVSGVNFAFAGNDAKFNVRGANSTNTFADNSSIVGAFVDGVYKLRASQQTRAFFDVERVEFLKGPQGTLYGRNTFAGALNLYTNKPQFDDYAAGLNGSYERFDRTRFEGYANFPLTDTFALRAAGFYDRSDGYIKNLSGPNIGAQNDKGVRLSALWAPTSRVDFLLRYHFIEEEGREAGLFGYTFICRRATPSGHTDPFGAVEDCANPQPGSGGLPNAAQLDPYTVSQDFVPNGDLAEHVVSLEVNLDLGPVKAKSITSYTDFENNLGFDFDFSPNPFQAGGFNEEAESFTQEIQLASNNDSRLQWTAGAYYSHDETNFNFFIFNQRQAAARGPATPVLDNAGNPVLDAMGAPLLLPVLSGTPLVNNDQVIGGFFADNHPLEIDYFGLYGQFEFSLTDEMRLIGGLRYNNEDKSLFGGGSNFTGDTDGDGVAEPPVVPTVPAGPFAGSFPTRINDVLGVFAINNKADDGIRADPKASENVSWRAGLEYDLNAEALLYATASRGFLSGSLNNNGTTTEDQLSRVIEAGVKSVILNGTLRFNLAGHYTLYKNLLAQRQVQIIVGGNPVVVTESANGGKITAWGIELETLWAPTDAVRIGLNASYLNSEFDRFGQSNPYQLLNGEVVGFVDLAGRSTPWSPDFTAALFGSYEFDLGELGYLTPYAQFYYSDGYNTSNLFSIDPLQQQGSFTKTDLRLIWESSDRAYAFEAFVENIEDEAVLARGNNNGNDIVQTGFNYPRNFGVRFRTHF